MSTPPTIHVLLVEDNPTDVLLAQDALAEVSDVELIVTERLAKAVDTISESRIDLVLLDLGLPDSQGLETLLKLRRSRPEIPVVIMTGIDDEELALRAVHEGAQDYLVKSSSQIWEGTLGRSIRYAIERQRLEETIREQAVLASLTADVGLAFTRGGPLRETLQVCTESMVRNLAASFARIWTLNEAEGMLELQASAGKYTHLDGPHGRVPLGRFKIGLIAQEKRPHLTNEVMSDPRISDPDWARREGMVAFAGYPLVIQDKPVGVMAMFAQRPLSDAVLNVMGAVANNIAVGIDRRRSEKALRESEERFREMAENIEEAVWMASADGSRILYVSPAYERITGQPCEVLYRTPSSFLDVVHDDDREKAETLYRSFPAKIDFEYKALRSDGSLRRLWVQSFPVLDAAGTAQRVVGVLRDVTEQRKLEEQFRQSQKMEAIGRLAGGVAHDFNNLLTVINSYSEMISSGLPADSPLRDFAHEIGQAGERAASLTRQLLAFSRKQVLEPKVLNLNAVVSDTAKMLQRLIGEDIELSTTLDPALGRVKVDPGQMEQILINLAVNARDAMPQGGKVVIETSNVELDETYTQSYPDLRPGPYVMLAVSDTGCGMDEATKARIFDPFFTTKEPGKGTGLGLASVFGIIKQSDGHIAVYSELERGTSFKVYFPLVNDVASPGRSHPDPGAEAPVHSTETVLLTEDEPALRALARQVLQMHGYTVLEASDGKEALRIADEYRDTIHLLVTDVVMPAMSGPELAERLIAVRPGMKVLYMSGYSDEAMVRHGVLEAKAAFLQKPFTPRSLGRKVREVLDR